MGDATVFRAVIDERKTQEECTGDEHLVVYAIEGIVRCKIDRQCFADILQLFCMPNRSSFMQ